MAGYPRYCVQCGNGLAPDGRFCGNCGHAAALPGAAPSDGAGPEAAFPEASRPEAGLPSSAPPVAGGPTAGRPAAARPNVTLPDVEASARLLDPNVSYLPEYDEPIYRFGDDEEPSYQPADQPSSPGLSTPASLAAPPSGPAYPPPAPAEPSATFAPSVPAPAAEPSFSPTEPAPPPSGPVYAATGPAYTPSGDRPSPPPPDRPLPPPPDRLGPPPPRAERTVTAPRPSYPPPPAQPALPAGSAVVPSSTPAPSAAPVPVAPPGETANFGRSWVNEVGTKPRWGQAPATPPYRQGSSPLPMVTDVRSADSRPRTRPALLIGLFVLVAAVLVVPAILIVHAFHGLGGSAAAAAQPTSAPAQSAAGTSEKAAATALAGLLAQSVTDRDTIVNAVGAVNNCTSALSQAPKQFHDSAASRQKLLQQLAHLPGRSKLPPAMLQQLTGAWQASATVDSDLGQWAQDEASRGCHPNDHANANFEASNTPDVQASNGKKAFLAQWNPIAAKYGLTQYSTSQF
jgi:hypothetical protein